MVCVCVCVCVLYVYEHFFYNPIMGQKSSDDTRVTRRVH